ncbi:MAG: leucine-rich repeat domain-containing protein [Planctomycetales bacterium]|nr:leucine-rich repeat domain-containing protein [Planctomycetales bacterium]
MSRLFLMLALAHIPVFPLVANGQVDTDGDGLLDLIDVPGFHPGINIPAYFHGESIEDLDGASLLVNTIELVLARNKITSIENGDFAGLSNLDTLILRTNEITSIESGDFTGLSNLRRLHLGDNQIASIEPDDFDGLDNLQLLVLNGNPITIIEPGDFSKITGLTNLTLANLLITDVQSHSFEELINLQSLDLSRNHITGIEREDFAGLANLVRLRLDATEIMRIDASDFETLANLQRLEMEDSQVSSIEPGAFAGMVNLSTLDLQGNPLSELNFTGAEFENLTVCEEETLSGSFLGYIGFCVPEIDTLILDDATLSQSSFGVIAQTPAHSVSMVGIAFSDMAPVTLAVLLGSGKLDNLRIDQPLYERYENKLDAFAADTDNSLTVIGYGDSNLDGVFDSSDFVRVFSAGEYEDDISGNSYWTEGDWNGDGDFDSSDLVVAFANGMYESGNQLRTVPEPAGALPLAFAIWGLVGLVRFRSNGKRTTKTLAIGMGSGTFCTSDE